MNRLESRIRDYLADHLAQIEPELSLMKKEFPLANSMGAGGSIDILAKDRFGHFVVIEIKRSDQAARAALHELTKYVALLKGSLGVRSEQIRALLLSTEWSELAVPFSEYQKICEVPTDGLILTAQSDGVVTKVEVFTPTDIEKSLAISRQQHVFLFEDAPRRDMAIDGVVLAATKAALKDFVVLAVDYEGGNQRVIYPHGAYVVFSSPLEGLSSIDAAKIKKMISWDEEVDDQDSNFLGALMEVLDIERDDSEIGYPEKLAAMASKGWRISVVRRAGRYATNSLLISDEILIAEAMKVEGGANYYMSCTVSPRYVPSWEKFKSDVRHVLLGNKAWSKVIFGVIDFTEKNQKQATVSLHIYNFTNIVFSLSKLCAAGDTRYMPSFQLVVTSGDEVTIYVGTLAWNG